MLIRKVNNKPGKIVKLTLATQFADGIIAQNTATSRLVIMSHGGGLGFEYMTGNAALSGFEFLIPLQKTFNYIAKAGYSVICPALYDLSITNFGDTVGNNVSTDLLDDVITEAKLLSGIGDSDKIALVGFSMGNLTNTNYLRRFGSDGRVAGILAINGVCNQEYFYNLPGGKAGTDEALDTTQYVGGVDAYDPKHFAPSLSGNQIVPWLGWTNSNDGYALPQDAINLSELWPNGMGSYEVRGEGEHDFSGCNGPDMLEWLNSLSWGN